MSDFEIHECKLQMPGARLIKSKSYFHEKFTWQLIIERVASEEDLEQNHYLENAGDQLWSVVAEVNHCPYCSLQLNENKNKTKEFVLLDSSDWSTNRL